MSFGRRVDLMRRVRELARRMEFLEAGEEPASKMDAALLQAEIDRLYVAWGLRAVAGLTVDGVASTGRSCRRGPEELFREALGGRPARDGAQRRRTKKLLVAFHFQFSNQAGWECDVAGSPAWKCAEDVGGLERPKRRTRRPSGCARRRF